MLWIALLLAISHVSYAANTQVVATNVTTDTTTAPVFTPSGAKSFYANVICTNDGACTQTVSIYGNPIKSNQNGLLLCTITLSGTSRAQDACPVVTANFTYTYIVTTNTTGVGATGAVYAMY